MTTRASKKVFEVKRLVKPFTLEELSESDGTFSGEAMLFDHEHPTSSWMLGPEWKDRVRPGAFTETLAAHAAAGTKPMMFYMHERGNIPGVWTDVKETKTHLKVSGQVSKNAVTPSGVPLLELMKMGAITGLSIGFLPTEVKLDERLRRRDIEKVELGEISIVDLPGAMKTHITDVKRDVRGLEEGLRALGLSRREAKALISQGWNAMFESEGKIVSLPSSEQLAKKANVDEFATKHRRAAEKAAEKGDHVAASEAARKATERAKIVQDGVRDEDSAMRAANTHSAAMNAHNAAASAKRKAAADARARGDEDQAKRLENVAEMHEEQEKGHGQDVSKNEESADNYSREDAGDGESGGDDEGSSSDGGSGGDEFNRDEDGKFSGGKKAADDPKEKKAEPDKDPVLSVASELKNLMKDTCETQEQKARRDAEARIIAQSIRDLARSISQD